MKFTKMHGLGNDFVCVEWDDRRSDDLAELARAVSDRHFGVGADGLILIMPSTQADVRMRIFNGDGSEAQTCGNGLRCVAKYAFEHGLSGANPMRVETAVAVATAELSVDSGGAVSAVTVDMGEPILAPNDIPVRVDGKRAVGVPIEAGGEAFEMTCVSMGNPHAVIYVGDVGAVDLARFGGGLGNHPLFPERTNVHFVQVNGHDEVAMRTWERGSGATLACGSGACAVCVAGVLTGRGERQITAHLPGGDLQLDWRQDDNHVYMTGPAAEVFSGVWIE